MACQTLETSPARFMKGVVDGLAYYVLVPNVWDKMGEGRCMYMGLWGWASQKYLGHVDNMHV